MSGSDDDPPPPPPPDSDDEDGDVMPPPRNSKMVMRRMLDMKWEQRFVTLLPGKLVIGKKDEVNLAKTTIVTDQKDATKLRFVLVTANDHYYLQAMTVDQRVQWLTSFLENGATVINVPSKAASNTQGRGWMKMLTGGEGAAFPADVAPLQEAANQATMEKQMAKESVKMAQQLTKLKKELKASSNASELATMRMEKAKLETQVASMSKLLKTQVNTIQLLDKEKSELLQSKEELERKRNESEQEFVMGEHTRNKSLSVLLFGNEDPSVGVVSPMSNGKQETDGLKAEIARLMQVNKRLGDDLADSRKQYLDMESPSSKETLIEHLRLERDEAQMQAADAGKALRSMEESAEELILSLKGEKSAVEEELASVKQQLAVVQAPKDRGSIIKSAKAKKSGAESGEYRELLEEKEAIQDEMLEQKEEYDVLMEQFLEMKNQLGTKLSVSD